jgi:hypothetical protein
MAVYGLSWSMQCCPWKDVHSAGGGGMLCCVNAVSRGTLPVLSDFLSNYSRSYWDKNIKIPGHNCSFSISLCTSSPISVSWISKICDQVHKVWNGYVLLTYDPVIMMTWLSYLWQYSFLWNWLLYMCHTSAFSAKSEPAASFSIWFNLLYLSCLKRSCVFHRRNVGESCFFIQSDGPCLLMLFRTISAHRTVGIITAVSCLAVSSVCVPFVLVLIYIYLSQFLCIKWIILYCFILFYLID